MGSVSTFEKLRKLAVRLAKKGQISAETAKLVQDAPDDALSSLTTGLDAKKRVGTTGQYIGAPQGLDTPQKLLEQRLKYLDGMNSGQGGREWYHDSSRTINEISPTQQAQHRRDPRELAARSLGRTSQGAGVDPNTNWGVKAHTQAMTGKEINSGRFPSGVSEDMEKWIETGEGFGPKLDPFAQNLRVDWDPSVGDRPVHDIWDGREWGYVGKDGKPWDQGFSVTQHKHMDEEAEAVTGMANLARLGGFEDWNHLRSQAASWTGAKIRAGEIKPEDAARHYGDFLDKSAVYLTRETAPGTNTGHLAGMHDAPYDVRKSYDEEVNKILYPEGRDTISDAYGALGGRATPGVGVYEEAINPGTIVTNYVGTKAGKVDPDSGALVTPEMLLAGKLPSGKAPKELQALVDPASRSTLDAIEGNYAWLTGQKAYAWNKPVYSKTMNRSMVTGADFRFDRPLSPEEMKRVADSITLEFGSPDAVGVAMAPDGVRFLDLSGRQVSSTAPAKGEKPAGVVFSDKVQLAVEKAGLPNADMRLGMFDSNYNMNSWDTPEGRYGQGHLQGLDTEAGGQPVFREAFDAVTPGHAARLKTLDEQFAREHGFTVSKFIQLARETVASEGIAGLDRLVRSGAIPKAVAAALVTNSLLDSEQAQAGPVSSLWDLAKKEGADLADDAAISKLVRQGYPENTARKIVSGELPMDAASRATRSAEQGYTVDALSGSTHDIPAFRGSLANPDSDWGRGSYASTSIDDVNANYAGVGPDLTQRIELRQEQIFDDLEPWQIEDFQEQVGKSWDDMTYNEKRDLTRGLAAQELKGSSEGVVYPLKLKTDEYVKIGGPQSTTIELDDDTYGRIYDALRDSSAYESGTDIDAVMEGLTDYIGDEIELGDLDALIRKHVTSAYDSNGDMVAPGGVSSEVFQNLGYKGVIDTDVDSKFGSRRRYGKPMDGVEPSTEHIVTFPGEEPNIRSWYAAFDPENKGINNLLAGLGGAAVLGGSLAPEDAEAGVITKGGKRLIEAWHGSPHSFDKFDINKIGTGEGAQAYGHGLYFADSQNVAKEYQRQLTDYRTAIDGVTIDPLRAGKSNLLDQFPGMPESDAEALNAVIGDIYADPRKRGVAGAKSDAEMMRNFYSEHLDSIPADKREAALQRIAKEEEKFRILNEYGDRLTDAKGSLYRTEIDVDPDTLLDYDKPLSEQSEAVRSAIEGVYRSTFDDPDAVAVMGFDGDIVDYAADHTPDEWALIESVYKKNGMRISTAAEIERQKFGSGAGFYRHLAEKLGGPDKLSDVLNNNGVPGIRYLDGVSRNAGDGTYNYVMFDDKPISIVERGMADPALLGAIGVGAATTTALAPEMYRQMEETRRVLSNFAQLRAPKASFWQQKRQELADLVGAGVGAVAAGYDQFQDKVYKPLQAEGYIPEGTPFADFFSTRSAQSQEPVRAVSALAALVATQDPQKAAGVYRMPQEQIADEAGGLVTDYLSQAGYPGIAPAAGTAVNTGINLAGF